MTGRPGRLLHRAFDLALRLYPEAFRARFGVAMAEAFVERVRARRHARGALPATVFALAALLNTAGHGIAERRLEGSRRRWTHATPSGNPCIVCCTTFGTPSGA